MKRFVTCCIICFAFCFSNLRACYAQLALHKYKFEILYDTLKKSNYTLLRLTINAHSNKLNIDSYFKDSEEFSFYNSELYDTTIIQFNGVTVKPKSGSFDVYRYVEDLNDTLMYVKKDSEEYFFLLGKPFFCNGVHCSTVYLTAIAKINGTVQGIDIETHYDDISKVYKKLFEMVKVKSFNLDRLKQLKTK